MLSGSGGRGLLVCHLVFYIVVQCCVANKIQQPGQGDKIENCINTIKVEETGQNICETCYPGYYTSEDKKSCLKCSDTCAECNGQASTCTACRPGDYLTEGTCKSCDKSACKECSQSPTQCTACEEGKVLFDMRCETCGFKCTQCHNKDTCVSCDHGYFVTDGKCEQCRENCDLCKDAAICEICDGGFYTNTVGHCMNCGDGCIGCQDGAKCQTCDEGFTLENNRCLKCQIDKCKKCENSSENCALCEEGFVLDNDGDSTKKYCKPEEHYGPLLYVVLIVVPIAMLGLLTFLVVRFKKNMREEVVKQEGRYQKAPQSADESLDLSLDYDSALNKSGL